MQTDNHDSSIINQTKTEFYNEAIPIDKIQSEEEEESKKDKFDINSYISEDQRAYQVLRYAQNCEDHNQISYIIPLARTTGKFILFIILNICTVGIINLFVAWFPKLILYIYFSVTDLESATHLGVFSKLDHEFEVVKKKDIDLPPIDYDNPLSVVKKLNLNIEHGATRIIVFEYKIQNYIYLPSKQNFESIYFQIKAPYHSIVEEYSAGLNPNEILYMKRIFGICDIDIKINSCQKIECLWYL